jgi:hypothetical protein
MLLTADHLAALEELGETAQATAPQFALYERASAIYRALERDGLARWAHGQSYVVTTAGRQAQRLVAGMLAAGYLCQRELMTPEWRFIDDTILTALQIAAHDADHVDLAAAPLLLGRGLAEVRDDPDELRMYVALTAFGTAWLELMGHLDEQLGSTYESVAAIDSAAGSASSEVQSHTALA